MSSERDRRFERQHLVVEAVVKTARSDSGVPATVVSLSRGGLGMFSTHYFEPESVVEVTLHIDDASGSGPVRGTLRGRVVSVRVDLAGNQIGIEFDEPLDPKNVLYAHFERARRAAG